MADKTGIEWCDSTFNPWIGCMKISPACDNCYAAVSTPARTRGIEWGTGKPRQRTSESNWHQPVKWNDMAGRGLFVQCDCGRREYRKWDGSLPPGGLSCCSNPDCNALPESDCSRVRPRVFCSSLADVFDNEVDPQWRADLFSLICATPNLDWLLLTKRIGNVSTMLNEAARRCPPIYSPKLQGRGVIPTNVWLGITVINQAEADRDIPKLLSISAPKRFLSIEPMLGEIDIRWALGHRLEIAGGFLERGLFSPGLETIRRLDWIICGGESGHNARPMHPDWATSLRDQCVGAGVPFLFKQWGEWAATHRGTHTLENYPHVAGKLMPDTAVAGQYLAFPAGPPYSAAGFPRFDVLERVGKKKAGRLLDGRTWNQYPEVQS